MVLSTGTEEHAESITAKARDADVQTADNLTRSIVETFLKNSGGIISGDPSGMTLEDPEDALNAPEVRSFGVKPQAHGQRLDRTLADAAPEFSRSYLQQLLERGLVRCNGVVARKPAQKVRAGDLLQVELQPTQESLAFRPESIDLSVVHEDDDILIINKPAGMVVHPAPGNWTGTLLNALLARHPAFSQVPRAGIVHRLDKDTSGLMVVARHREAMDALVRAIAAREVHRQYVALAHGRWSGPATRRVDAPIGRDPRNRLRMAVVDLAQDAGKLAQTDISLLANLEDACWVRCVLHTGRTHQIRVHMASLGHPLVADALYGGKAAAGLTRQALHAEKLQLIHPRSGQPTTFIAQLPDDIRSGLDQWGLRYNGPEG